MQLAIFCKHIVRTVLTDLLTQFVIRLCIYGIVELTKNGIGNCNFMQLFFSNMFVRAVLTDLLDTSCQ